MRIGVTGTHSGGKDKVGAYLESLGFAHVPTGDLIREEAKRRGIDISKRENLQMLGNRLRLENGPGYLSRIALTRFPDNLVISGLRNMGEVKEGKLRFLISIDAPVEWRYEWLKQRGKLSDNVDFETFRCQEEYEMGHDETGLQLGDVMAAADVKIWNGKKNDLGPVYREVDLALERFRE